MNKWSGFVSWRSEKRLDDGPKREFLEAYRDHVVLPSMPILQYDQVAATWHAQERARLVRAGQTPPYSDGPIAGISVTRGLILVTRNVADFSRFSGLHVENWFEGE